MSDYKNAVRMMRRMAMRFDKETREIEKDLRMFHAPQECYQLAYKSVENRHAAAEIKVLSRFGFSSYEEFYNHKEIKENGRE
jgi:hypothetical protein